MSVGEAATGDQERATARAKRPRSAITSGRQMFVQGDPNSAWSRRYHDLVVRHVGDLGGRDLLSEAQLSLIRRATSIECELERLDAMLSTGAEVDLDAYGRASSHLRRIFEVLGLERRCRDVTLIDGTVEAPFSPLRARWQAEAEAAKAAEGVTE
jgi:hypothetical protein